MQVLPIIYRRDGVERLGPRIVQHEADRPLHVMRVAADQQPGTAKRAKIHR